MPAHAWRVGETWHTLSYRDYRQQVLEVACGLISLADVKVGDYVAIMAANRFEHVVASVGVMHTGAAPSTFYSTLAPEQIQYVAENCSARVAILENSDYLERWLPIRDRLPALEHIVMMEGAEAHQDVEGLISWDRLRALGRDTQNLHGDRWRDVKPEDPATLIYTSGTTGPPKGVVLTHENCTWEARAICDHIGVTRGVTMVSYLPLAHIAEQLLSIFLPLVVQGQSFFCPDVKQALDFVRKARPAAFFGVPRVWEKMRAALTAKLEAAAGLKGSLARAALDAGTRVVRLEQKGQPVPLLLKLKAALLDRLILAKIRAAIGLDRCRFAASAAAPLPVDVAEFFAALGLPLIEVWGMTETTGVGTAPDPARIKIGSVGPALPGVEVKLGDDGELLVRGPNCTPGYLDLPEQTAELIDEDGWLHSGDIAERDGDGYFRIVDRKKELIITAGGKNISPVLVESLLKEHPLVGQALAFGDRRPYVVALIVLDGEVAPAWAEQQGITVQGVAELARHPRVRQEVEQAVERANCRLARVEQVKRFEILPAEWTAESEELTPTMKLKRRVIHDKYLERIEALYAPSTERPTG
jgi:long-chain acyl-CoA synthetase